MKLFLVSQDKTLLYYWQKALQAFNPVIFQSIQDISPQSEAVVFMLVSSDIQTIQAYPRLRFMVLSNIPDFTEAQKYLRNGAFGYGNAMMHESHLVSAFKTLEDGKVWLYPDFVTQLIHQVQDHALKQEKSLHCLDALSVREKEVALLLGDGKSHLEISETLGITIRTVKAHSASIYEKLQVKDRLALSLLLHS